MAKSLAHYLKAMETTLHLVRLVRVIWLAQQKTLWRLLIGLTVLMGLALAQNPRFSVGRASDTGTLGSLGGVWLELGSYSTNPEQSESWLRGSFYGQEDSELMVGLRSRQELGLAQFTIGAGLGLRSSDMRQYKEQTGSLEGFLEAIFLVGVFKVILLQISLGLDFPLDKVVGLNFEGYGSGSIIGGLSYGFRGGISLRLGL